MASAEPNRSRKGVTNSVALRSTVSCAALLSVYQRGVAIC